MTLPLAPRLSSLNLEQKRSLVESEIAQPHLDWEVWTSQLDPQSILALYPRVGQVQAFFPLSRLFEASHLSFLEQGVRLEKWLKAFGYGHEQTDSSFSTRYAIQVWINLGGELSNMFTLPKSDLFFQQKKQFLNTLQAFLDHGGHSLLIDSFLDVDLFEDVMLQEHVQEPHSFTSLQILLRKKLCQETWQLMFAHLSDQEVMGLAKRFNNFDDNLLHDACWIGQIWVLEALQKRNFPLDQRNNSGQTPLELAIGHEYYEVANWLKQHSPTPPQLTPYDDTIFDCISQLWIRQQQGSDIDVGHALEHFCHELRLPDFQDLWKKVQHTDEAKVVFGRVFDRIKRIVEFDDEQHPQDARLNYFLHVIPVEWWNDVKLRSPQGMGSVHGLDEIIRSTHPALQRLAKGIIDKQRQQLNRVIPSHPKSNKVPKIRL